jgi:hypothetical protein
MEHLSVPLHFGDCFTCKYNPQGQQMWVSSYNGVGNRSDAGQTITISADHHVYAAGFTMGGENDVNYLTIKYGQSTEFVISNPVNSPASFQCKASPNPFNPSTVISYELQAASYAKLTVWDISGKQVATLVDGWREAGSRQVTFDGSNLPSGLYLYRLTAGQNTATGKMVLLK